jgi:ethanolaminephosphotransferase
LLINCCRRRWDRFPSSIVHPAVIVLLFFRIARRWNQTGQKYAGESDIVQLFTTMRFGSAILWSLIGATYLDITTRLSRHVARTITSFTESDPDFEPTDWHRMMGVSIVLPLGATAFVFKLAFTVQDAPELTTSVSEGITEWAKTLNLVGIARMVFAGLVLTKCSMMLGELLRARRRKGRRGGGRKFSCGLFPRFNAVLN